VLWHRWLGHLACKSRPGNTYNVSSGTLSLYSPTHCCKCRPRRLKWWFYARLVATTPRPTASSCLLALRSRCRPCRSHTAAWWTSLRLCFTSHGAWRRLASTMPNMLSSFRCVYSPVGDSQGYFSRPENLHLLYFMAPARNTPLRLGWGRGTVGADASWQVELRRRWCWPAGMRTHGHGKWGLGRAQGEDAAAYDMPG